MNLEILQSQNGLIHWYSSGENTNAISFHQQSLERYIYASMKVKALIVLCNSPHLPPLLDSYHSSNKVHHLDNAIVLPSTAKSLVPKYISYLNN
jgi:hypothetical protein